MAIYKKLLLAVAFAATAGFAVAQTNGSNSPYSRYGYGLLGDRAGGFNKGMAGTGYGFASGTELNAKNPASYAAIDSLSMLFDIGMSLQNATISSGNQRVNAKNTSLDYLMAGFRLAPRLGMAVGVLPYSTIGYSMTGTTKVGGGNKEELTSTVNNSGDGGLHEAFLGLGWAPVKNFSLGANVGFLWGELSHTVLTSYSDANTKSLRRRYETELRTFKADFGINYTQPLNKNNTLSLGVTYGLGHDINSDADFYSQMLTSGVVSAADTIRAANAYSLPHTVGAGLVWNWKGRLRIGADYTWEKWSDVKSPSLTEKNGVTDYRAAVGNFTDCTVLSLGCEFVPDPQGFRWRQLVRYRAGVSYSTPYAKIDGHDGPRTLSVSLGAGFPIRNIYSNRTVLNVAAQYERVEPAMAGMITENYLRLSIGISFNEKWFTKWKVQ